MAQVVEHLLCKLKTLTSNPSTTKNKQNKNPKEAYKRKSL
jgi:hypothetical protein